MTQQFITLGLRNYLNKKKLLKLLQISNKAPYPANDGSSIAIYNMACGFIQNNVDLHLLTINTKKHFKADADVPADFKLKSNYKSIYKNTNTTLIGAALNLFSTRSYFVSRFYFKDFETQLIKTLQQTQFDIIQLEGLFMGVYIDVIKKYCTSKIVLRAHNVEHLIWERHLKNEANPFKKWYIGIQTKRLKQFEILTLNKVDSVISITNFDKAEFEKLNCTKPIYTCITGVNVNDYQQKISEVIKPNTVFYFASMDWLPNQEAVKWFLDNCWATVYSAVPEAKLIIAGHGMPNSLKHLNKPNVVIIENVTNGKLFYQQHQLMIVPLLSGSGLRIKIIEGMAYGKAIVSTSVGAEGIDYTHNSNIIIANEATQFAHSVIELLQNKSLQLQLQTNATKLAYQKFDNFKVVAELVNFYNQLLNV